MPVRQFRRCPQCSHRQPDIYAEISIPGVRNLFDSRYSKSRKVLWSLAILASAALCFIQVRDRVDYYISTPVATRIELVRNQSIMFPSVLLCPFYPFTYELKIHEMIQRISQHPNSNQEEVVWKLLDLDDVNVTILWNVAALDENKVFVSNLCEFQRRNNCNKNFTFKKVATYIGTCVSLSFVDIIEYDGPYNGLEISVRNYDNYNDIYWKFMILLHQKGDIPIHNIYSEVGQMVHPNRETTVSFSMKHYIRNSTSKERCEDPETSSKCWTHCIEEHILKNSTCRLPYINNEDYPLCDTADAAAQTYAATRAVYMHMNELCHPVCPIKCIEYVYTINQDVVMFKHDHSLIKVLAQDNTVEVIRTFRSQSFYALISEIGGIMGLFLGFCFLTVLQLFELFVMMLKQAMERRQ